MHFLKAALLIVLLSLPWLSMARQLRRAEAVTTSPDSKQVEITTSSARTHLQANAAASI